MKRTFEVGIIWCANRGGRAPLVASGGACRTGWVFPPNVEKQLKADSAGKTVLHLFGGKSRFGTRQDIDPDTKPDVIADAWLPPFAERSFDVVIIDPPYVHMNSQVKNALMRAAAYIARERVIWFHTLWISAGAGLSTERAWLVRVGDNCQARVLQYFTIRKRYGPVKHFLRGPAMKYNRWLAQPQALPLYGEQYESDVLAAGAGVDQARRDCA